MTVTCPFQHLDVLPDADYGKELIVTILDGVT
jgi:hypothetical protein